MRDEKPSDLIPTPSGCRWCGIDKRDHLQRWTKRAGWHTWEPPTIAQRKARILARRRDPEASRRSIRHLL
jgi:hypothetical protein